MLFAPDSDRGLFKVSEAGGPAQPATTLNTSRGDIQHRYPQFLPDGKSFLFNVRGREPGVYVGALDSQDTKKLLPDVLRAFYVASGFLIFQRGPALLSVRLWNVWNPPGRRLLSSTRSSRLNSLERRRVTLPIASTVTSLPSWPGMGATVRASSQSAKPGPYRRVAMSL